MFRRRVPRSDVHFLRGAFLLQLTCINTAIKHDSLSMQKEQKGVRNGK